MSNLRIEITSFNYPDEVQSIELFFALDEKRQVCYNLESRKKMVELKACRPNRYKYYHTIVTRAEVGRVVTLVPVEDLQMYTLPQETIVTDQVLKEIYVAVNWQKYDVAFFTSRSDMLKWEVGDENNEYTVYRFDAVTKQTEMIPNWEIKEILNVEKR